LATGTEAVLERLVTMENTLPNEVLAGIVRANL